MRNRLQLIAGRLLLLLPLFSLPSFAAPSKPVLQICYESRDVRPWRTADGQGLNFVLLDLVARQAGVQFKFEGRPWKRCLAEMQSNLFDGVIGASFLPERMEFGRYPGGNPPDASARLHSERYILVRRSGSAVNWNGQSFSNLTGPVGIQNGYSISDRLRQLDVAVDGGAPGARELLLKVSSGRLEIAALQEGEARQLLDDRQFAKQLEILPVPLQEKAYFAMFSHRFADAQPELADKIWRTIALVRDGATYRKAEVAGLKR